MITVHLIGDQRLIAKLNRLAGGDLQSGIARTMLRLAMELKGLVQQKLSGPVLQTRSGRLRGSIQSQVQQTDVGVEASVSTDVPYAPFQEFGVPHSWEIRPRTARALAFEVNGQTIFAMHVTHPPLPERSFMRSALREMAPQIRSELQAAVNQELQR
jgi:phage gpG-like protein